MTAEAIASVLDGPAIFLSPHFDDVALSCGGTVALVVDRGHPAAMITIFGGEITDDLTTDFARWKHSRWGIGEIGGVLEQRRAEDAAAAAVLGCASRTLGVPDAIYRAARYTSDQQLFKEGVSSEDAGLVDLLYAEVKGLPEWRDDARVFVPLGAGGHADHRITFDAGRRLASEGVRVFAYEDTPYAIHTPDGVATRLAELGDAVGDSIVVSTPTLERRLDAIATYVTQVPVIFRFTDDFRGAVRGLAERVGAPGAPAERFWPLRRAIG